MEGIPKTAKGYQESSIWAVGTDSCDAQSCTVFAMMAPMSTESEKDCPTGFCAPQTGGPSPFANQPPLGLSLLAQDDPEDVLPDWPKIAPDLPQDTYSIADALWWCHKLGERSARGEDVAYMLTSAADARAVPQRLGGGAQMVAGRQCAPVLEVRWHRSRCGSADSCAAAGTRGAHRCNHGGSPSPGLQLAWCRR